MKKVFWLTLATIIGIPTLSFAADNNISITEIYADSRTVYVETVNNSETDTMFMLTVMKEDGQLTRAERVYAIFQEPVKAGTEKTFEIFIRDNNDGLRGTGTYRVMLQDHNEVRDVETIQYADGITMADFLMNLKTAASAVTDKTVAYEALSPIMADCAGVLFSCGLDGNLYAAQSAEVQKDSLNYLYQSGVASFTEETFPKAISQALGLGIYNNGEKKKGLETLQSEHGGEEVDAALFDTVVSMMANSYDTTEDFEKGFKQAYGLVTINRAKVGVMHDALQIFKSETGVCSTAIDKIAGLLPTNRYTAYEYIVTQAGAGRITGIAELETVLGEAYTKAIGSGTTGGGAGGGAGGGIAGGVGNKTPVEDSSAAVTTGSGTPDIKNDSNETMIFTDLSEKHWAANSVKWLKEKGIVSGTDSGAFEPDRQVTREEFTKMIALACGLEVGGQTVSFTDAESGAWYVPYLGAAVDAGIVGGIGDNQFGIGWNITRQDMAVMVERALKAADLTPAKVKDYTAFDDEAAFADYAKDAIKVLFEAGIINGKGANSFDAGGNATRAEAAKIIYEAFK